MEKKCYVTAMLMFFVLICQMVSAGEKAPQKVLDLANKQLAAIGSNPVVVAAVKAQNSKNMKLEQIKEMDEKWKQYAGVADYMQQIMVTDCAKALYEIQKEKPYLAEIFVMDNQGANVAMTDKTSDYWQGDEAKFQKSFAGGTGMVFVDEVEYDDSAQAYLVQVSVPVKDNGVAIGAITFGIDVDMIE